MTSESIPLRLCTEIPDNIPTAVKKDDPMKPLVVANPSGAQKRLKVAVSAMVPFIVMVAGLLEPE